MKVGIIGLGKLGLPVALGIESKGHRVKGFDLNPAVQGYLNDRQIPFVEQGIQPLLDSHNIELISTQEMVGWADIIFLAVQTPHDPRYEGVTRLPEDRKDFDYSYLKTAIADVAIHAMGQKKKTTLVVISTCLPGTYKEQIEPLLNEYVEYLYNPFFIAMGTVLRDFFDPEFVLIGNEGDGDTKLWRLYGTIHDNTLFYTDVTTAEAIKVSYNTFITTKTVLGNLWGQIAQKTGANVNDIFEAWSLATDRLISPRYLKAGMSDGGGCHPRDNIALSYLSDKIGLKFNYFEALMKARESHEEYLADMIPDGAVLFGRAFKPETNIETGSPAILLANILKEQQKAFTHEEDPEPGVFNVITCKHKRYADIKWPYGSTVLDPFGYIPYQNGIRVIQPGRL